jgi:phosphoribosyl-dephospho-CoA transferase
VLDTVTPQGLACSRRWRSSVRRCLIPAIDALEEVEIIMTRHGFAEAWGPTGSVGFELASGYASATAASDLDLALWSDRPPEVIEARPLASALASLAVRTDLLVETPQGAVALAELARGGQLMLRTGSGPRLIAG